ncbi:MAG: hypothetical protein ABIH76_01225 [Candidatus Bathyarchaeota archaeon]
MMATDRIRRELIRRYNANPEGWRVLVGRDPKGYYDLLVNRGSELWLMKEFQVNPYESIGFGVKEKVEENDLLRRIDSVQPFGLRPLSAQQIEEMTSAMQREETIDRIIQRVMETKPVPISTIKTPVVMQGPIIHSPENKGLISDRHGKLDLKLRGKLDDVLRRNYPYLLRQYI